MHAVHAAGEPAGDDRGARVPGNMCRDVKDVASGQRAAAAWAIVLIIITSVSSRLGERAWASLLLLRLSRHTSLALVHTIEYIARRSIHFDW